jgi:DNA polymerase III subunit epsilon
MLRQHDVQDLVDRLERDGSHRVLRKLEVADGRTAVPFDGGHTAIGIGRFRFDDCGRILKLDSGYSWFEEPGEPLSDEVARITGLSDAGLIGHEVDEGSATRLLQSADLVIAHNSAFDRKFVERRLPDVAGLPWACSMCEVDWSAAGFDGRSLGWLGAQAGWFHDAHRASGDVDAVIALLTHVLPDGRTVLAELAERSAQPTMLIEVLGSDYAVKDQLRARGYRWKPEGKIWWKEVVVAELSDEQAWLGRTIYGFQCKARSGAPRITQVTARDRYA